MKAVGEEKRSLILRWAARMLEAAIEIKFARHASSQFAVGGLSAALPNLDRTWTALLARAFRGELVPQDPNDEPADAMLARLARAGIRGERVRRGTSTSVRTGSRGLGMPPKLRACRVCLLVLGATASLGPGCVSARDLVLSGRFDEACVATRTTEQREATAQAIAQTTDATIQIRALGPDEIKKEFVSNPLDAHSLLLHVTTDAHVTPNSIDIQVLFVRSDRIFAGPVMWSPKQLAKLLGLGTVTSKYDSRGLLDRVLPGPPHPAYRTDVTCSSDADCADRVPFAGAIALRNQKDYARCDQGRNQPCSRHVLLNDYPPNEPGRPLIRLLVRHSFKTCFTEHLIDVPLPDGATAAERINHGFVAGPIRLADLRGHEPLDGSWLARCSRFPEAPDCVPPRLP